MTAPSIVFLSLIALALVGSAVTHYVRVRRERLLAEQLRRARPRMLHPLKAYRFEVMLVDGESVPVSSVKSLPDNRCELRMLLTRRNERRRSARIIEGGAVGITDNAREFAFEVIIGRGDPHVRTIRVAYQSAEILPLELDATNDGVAMETLLLHDVRYLFVDEPEVASVVTERAAS